MHPNKYKGKEMKLIEPKKTKIHPKSLQRKMRSAKDGMRGQFLVGAYGCGACSLKEHCSEYPASKGICTVRAKMYVEYLKAGRGEIVPIMTDTLAKLSIERDIEQTKGIEQGKLTEEFFKLSHLCIKLQEKIQNATIGSKIKVEHSWVDELRDAINITAKVKDEPDNNPSKQGTEENLREKVPESPGTLSSD